MPFLDVTSQADVEFRIIHYDSRLMRLPYFIVLDFPERAGALRDFLTAIQSTASICYFNYTNTGEQIGRALIGFEFNSHDERNAFLKILRALPYTHRELDAPVLSRML